MYILQWDILSLTHHSEQWHIMKSFVDKCWVCNTKGKMEKSKMLGVRYLFTIVLYLLSLSCLDLFLIFLYLLSLSYFVLSLFYIFYVFSYYYFFCHSLFIFVSVFIFIFVVLFSIFVYFYIFFLLNFKH